MEQDKYKDYWTIIFSIISLILANLAIFIPKQRMMILSFTIVSAIFAFFLFYINKINKNERTLDFIKEELTKLRDSLTEKFNYLKEIYNLRVEIEMLKKKGKKGQINLEWLFKVLIAVILVYVILQVIKSLSPG